MVKSKVDDDHLIGIIKHNGVVNVQELCRLVNGREFKWCHKKHDKYQHIDTRIDNQFVKQCNDCQVHYRDIHKQVMRLTKEGKISSEVRMFYDRRNDEGDLYPKKKDRFRFCYVDFDVFKKRILSWTLDGY